MQFDLAYMHCKSSRTQLALHCVPACSHAPLANHVVLSVETIATSIENCMCLSNTQASA